MIHSPIQESDPPSSPIDEDWATKKFKNRDFSTKLVHEGCFFSQYVART